MPKGKFAALVARDREFWGSLAFGGGLAGSALLAYAFNALMGRRLSAADFGTFGALLAVMMALSGPSTALYGGGAMSAARTGRVPRPPWRRLVGVGAGAGLLVGVLPLSPTVRAFGWFGAAAFLWMLVAWNRGLLIGLGKIGLVGVQLPVDALARLAIALALVARGWGVAGASGGLALGMGFALLMTELFLPRGRRDTAPLGSDVWGVVVGLFFLSATQFPDVVAVRLLDPDQSGGYTAASSLARVVLYAVAPAAAYALRRTAVVGARRSFKRTMILAVGPSTVAAAILLAVPERLLSLTYGGRYVASAGLIRPLTLAYLLAGTTLVLLNMCIGAGRSGWAWSVSFVAVAGGAGIFAVAATPGSAAITMLLLQVALCAVAALHAARLFATERPAGGAVVFLNWRDTRHPQGGGSEVFVEEIAAGLARMGRRVTVFCAAHQHAPREEVRDGVRYVRRGTWWSVYPWAAVLQLLGRFGPHDTVVDVQNAVPFFSPVYCGRRVVVLVHHVHREQWGMLFGHRTARFGWWVESWLAPRMYRRARYATVSEATRRDLSTLGIAPERVAVVRNGSPSDRSEAAARAARPTVAYLGRLVPHKRVEVLLDSAAALRSEFPDLCVRIIGHGGWDRRLRAHAASRGVEDLVSFEGHVDEEAKRRLLAEAWVLALPSVQEGWGLSVVEAAAAQTPAVAFRVGGLRESIVDGETGLLADTPEEFADCLRSLLGSEELRVRLGRAAQARARNFTWEDAVTSFDRVLADPAPLPGRVPPPERAVVPAPFEDPV